MMDQVLQHPEWRIIVDLIKERPYGVIILHSEIEQATGLQRGARYYAQVGKAKNTLIKDHQKWIENVSSQGYQLVLPGEHNKYGREKVMQGLKDIKKSVTIVGNAPRDLLSVRENAVNDDALCKFSKIVAITKAAIKETAPRYIAKKFNDPKMITA